MQAGGTKEEQTSATETGLSWAVWGQKNILKKRRQGGVAGVGQPHGTKCATQKFSSLLAYEVKFIAA